MLFRSLAEGAPGVSRGAQGLQNGAKGCQNESQNEVKYAVSGSEVNAIIRTTKKKHISITQYHTMPSEATSGIFITNCTKYLPLFVTVRHPGTYLELKILGVSMF